MTDFDQSFSRIIGVEGGYSNNPDDPGGETMWGICKRDHPDLDIKNLTQDQAKAIYKTEYWDKIKGDQLPYPLNLFMFDAAVNQGTDAAIKCLQKTLNIAQDGILGVQTMKGAQAMRDDAIALYMADRAVRYTGTRNADKFLRGWMKRLFVITMGR
jgi:lysozyme family protein